MTCGHAADSNRQQTITGAATTTNYQYAAAGNLIANGEYTFGYGARARLNTVNGKATAEYRYNALGQRTYKRVTDGETPDYLALDAEAVAQAEALQNQADTLRQQSDQATQNATAAREEVVIARKAAAEATATNEENRATALQQQANDTQQAAAARQAEAENYLSQSTEPTNNLKEHRFVYGPNNRLIGEYQGNGALKQDIIRLGTLPVATVDASGAIHYIHTDHLGTPRAATMPNGDVVWNWISSPFGDTKANEDVDGDGNTFTLNLRFPGQYFDEETELHYNYFRDYDPGTGRYVQSDPIGLNGGLNTYAYVGGNPLS